MTRISSLNILADPTGKDYLKEEYGKVIANVQKNTISQRLKNTDLSGDPTAGTVEAKRFQNITSNAYGTARSGGAGQLIKAKPVTVAINTDKELIHEVEEKDTRLYGVDGLITREAAKDQLALARELERAFFAAGATEGTAVTLTTTDPLEQLEELIQTLETVSNDYVDGVPRELMHIAAIPSMYGKVQTKLDTLPNTGMITRDGDILGYHNVAVDSSTYLPDDVLMMIQISGAIAQPVMTTLDEAGKIEMSNAYHFGMFYSYGTKVVTPDLVFYVAVGDPDEGDDDVPEVPKAPVITIGTQPADVSVTVGAITEKLSVAATATESATLTYQWYSNETDSNTGGTSLGATGGAQTAELTIPTDLEAGTYYYYCIVSATGAEAVKSDPATVTASSGV